MIDFHTAPTPNGKKVAIALEEMALPYTLHRVDLGKKEQKTPEFLAMNLNGRIPVIVDHDLGLTLAESGAILLHLGEKTGKFLPTDPKGKAIVTQWLMFQMSAVGPMMGQANVFVRYAPERIPYAIDRYQRESRRIFEVLDSRLADVEYLGGDYSVADMATYPWIAGAGFAELDTSGLPNLARWLASVGARPAVQRGMNIPSTESDADRLRAARSILT